MVTLALGNHNYDISDDDGDGNDDVNMVKDNTDSIADDKRKIHDVSMDIKMDEQTDGRIDRQIGLYRCNRHALIQPTNLYMCVCICSSVKVFLSVCVGI